MLQQARNWLNQRFSSRVAAAARTSTTSGAKDKQQKRLFSSYDTYNTHEAPPPPPKGYGELGTLEGLSVLSAYIAYFFGSITPVTAAINKGQQNDINEHLNKKNLGPVHKRTDYNDQDDTYKMP